VKRKLGGVEKFKLMDVTDLLSRGEVSFTSLVDHVAREMVDADLPSFGKTWPWPTGDEPFQIQARMEARELAKVAIKAFLSWEGHTFEEKEIRHDDPNAPKYTVVTPSH
jgi:hypothetical protein